MPHPARSELDKALGMLYYSTETEGTGGILRKEVEDFIVVELMPNRIACLPGVAKTLSTGSGDYVWFVLEKRGVDTVTALKAVARALGVSHKRLSVAGLKDASALALQVACVEGVEPARIPSQVGEKIRIHDVFRMPFKLSTGMLCGNLFEVLVRDMAVCSSAAEERIKGIAEELEGVGGAPNYYGYQRFGTIRPLTHTIGKYVLLGRFEEAVGELLTRVFPRESERAKEARLYLASTWDIEGALKIFPRRLHHERAVLHYLAKHPEDCAGAIRTLPLSVRLLFVEAYQSYLFNKVLSRRMELGLPLHLPVEGDLLAIGECGKAILRVRDSNLDKMTELVLKGRAEAVGNVFGYASVLAEGVPGEIEREVLREEGASLGVFKVKGMPELSSRGTVRPLTLMPEDFAWGLESPCSTRFKFSLRKGMYATVFLREFVKPTDPAGQGF